MEQTKNYKLSQWELSDRIQMKDFNGDNAKVEQALASLESRKLEPLVVLDVEETISGKTTWLVSVKGLNLGQYFGVFAEVTLPDKTPTCSFRENGSHHIAYVDAGKNVLLTFPARNPEIKCTMIAFPRMTVPNTASTSFQDLASWGVFTPSGTLEGTFRLRVWVLP